MNQLEMDLGCRLGGADADRGGATSISPITPPATSINQSFRPFGNSRNMEMSLQDVIVFNGLNGAQRLNDLNILNGFGLATLNLEP
jgi:hypothetical protein